MGFFKDEAVQNYLNNVPKFTDSHAPHDWFWVKRKVVQLRDQLRNGEFKSMLEHDAALAKAEIWHCYSKIHFPMVAEEKSNGGVHQL